MRRARLPPALGGQRGIALGAALAAALALAVAHGAEEWGGLVPCALCLWERWPYRAALALGLLGARAPGRAVLWALMAAFAAAAALGAVHVGVEFGWWPSPLPECAARLPVGGSIMDRFAAMPARPSKPCDEPTFPLPFVPLSMAAMNAIYAAMALAATALAARRR